MKCPTCRRAIKVDATVCICGWTAGGSAFAQEERTRQIEHYRAREQEVHRREVAEFMQREGLHSAADCRAFVRKKLASKTFMRPDPEDHWRKVLSTAGAGFAAQEAAREVLQRIERRKAGGEREPGEDDEMAVPA